MMSGAEELLCPKDTPAPKNSSSKNRFFPIFFLSHEGFLKIFFCDRVTWETERLELSATSWEGSGSCCWERLRERRNIGQVAMDRQLGQGGERSRVEIKCGKQGIVWKMGKVKNY